MSGFRPGFSSAFPWLVASVACIAAATPAAAQDSTQSGPPSEFALRSSGDFTFMQSRPQGAFASNVNFGYGVNAAYLFALDRANIFSLRADVGFLQYGHFSKRVPLSQTVGDRILVTVSTDNNIVPVSFGPQLTWPRGAVRPYVNAAYGGQFFFTQSSLDDDDASSDFSTTNQHDHTHSWILGGGVYIPVSTRHVSVLLDLGAQYFTGGHAQYLCPDCIQDQPDGSILVSPLESDTHMLLVRMGVKVGLERP